MLKGLSQAFRTVLAWTDVSSWSTQQPVISVLHATFFLSMHTNVFVFLSSHRTKNVVLSRSVVSFRVWYLVLDWVERDYTTALLNYPILIGQKTTFPEEYISCNSVS